MNKIKQKLEIEETRSVIELTYAVLGCTGWLFPLLPDVTEDGCHFRLISHTPPSHNTKNTALPTLWHRTCSGSK